MTVAELIEKLAVWPKDALVVVDGYEEGFAEDIKVKRISIVVDRHGESDGALYGRHGRVDKWNGARNKHQKKAIFIGEGRHLESGA